MLDLIAILSMLQPIRQLVIEEWLLLLNLKISSLIKIILLLASVVKMFIVFPLKRNPMEKILTVSPSILPKSPGKPVGLISNRWKHGGTI